MKTCWSASFLLWCCYAATGQCLLGIPENLKLKNPTSCTVDVSWKVVPGAEYYRLEYRITGSAEWQLSNPTNEPAVTITGLNPNTSYDFAVASFCSDSSTAGFSQLLAKTTKKCSAPLSPAADSVTTTTATIHWTAVCNYESFTLQYRLAGNTSWQKIKNIDISVWELSGLFPDTTYEFRVQADCGASNSSWSLTEQFTTAVPPQVLARNIVLILLDDGRYDAFQPNGGPAWFPTPSINRIAEEGVNFQITLPTTSQCSPSRACIYSGLYPHTSDVTKNGDTMNASLPLIQQVLRDHGYYTGLIGKYGQFFGDPKGFNWWAVSEGDEYINPPYRINGMDTLLPGHILDVYPQLALQFLESVPVNKNFVLFYFTRAPHHPTVPRPEDASLYTGEEMPFPSNFKFYQNNYPSFYEDHKWNADSAGVNSHMLKTFQTLKATDDHVDTILTWLEQNGVIDSTLILFTSDNGYIMGEHKMDEKILALEESIRIPLFIRYPSWFAPSTVITDQIASNLDFATTFLELAGIQNEYGFQGLSLNGLANGTVTRKNFLYESGYDPMTAKLRAVRTLDAKFIRSYCKTVTEEFYDLSSDPRENTNEIFNPAYASTIDSFRILLDSLRSVYADNTPNKKLCSLIVNGVRIMNEEDSGMPFVEWAVSPNPAQHTVQLYYASPLKSPARLKIHDGFGRLVFQKEYRSTYLVEEDISVAGFLDGIYLLTMEQDASLWVLRLLVQH